MKLSELTDHDEVGTERRVVDPEYAAESDRLASASALSIIVVDYRAKHELSQAELGRLLGWKQPQVARLERGDHVPNLETLELLARNKIVTIRVDDKGTSVKSPARQSGSQILAEKRRGGRFVVKNHAAKKSSAMRIRRAAAKTKRTTA